MKKILFMVTACLALLLAMSCTSTIVNTSTTPHLYTNSTSTEFEILGEIIYESKDRVGFIELLRAARNLYPDCDYVIDIMMDQKTTTQITTTKFFMRRTQSVETNIVWVMRGTAIGYK